MNFTFGIVTGKIDGDMNHVVNTLITSITEELNRYEDWSGELPECQIVIAAGTGDAYSMSTKGKKREITIFEVPDKHQKNIAKKKNIITQFARYDNVVYMHDYITLVPGWLKGFVQFTEENPDWEVAMNVLIQEDGTRFRDWISFDDPDSPAPKVPNNHPDIPVPYSQPYLPGYDFDLKNKYYINGSYWVAKKHVMEEYPLDEKYEWGEPEDITWSYRIRDKVSYKMNTYSAVQFLKNKDNIWPAMNKEVLTNAYITKELVNYDQADNI